MNKHIKLAHPILTMLNLLVLASFLAVGAAFQAALASDQEQFHVGVQPDGRIVVPTNQVLEPAGTQITFPGRPVDLALADDGKLLVVKNSKDLVLIDPVTGRLRQTVSIPRQRTKPPGFSVVGGEDQRQGSPSSHGSLHPSSVSLVSSAHAGRLPGPAFHRGIEDL